MEDKFYYRQIGEKGTPLVFIHGILGFWRNFYSASHALKPKHKSLLYDQRGHGRSFHSEPYTVKQLALDLKNMLDFLNWPRVSLVGHSLGGYVALLFAKKFPDRVQKIVIVDSSPWPLASAGKQIEDILFKLPDSFPHRRQGRDFFKKAVAKGLFSRSMADFLMASLNNPAKGPVRFLFDREGLLKLLPDVRRANYPSILSRLKIPILILRGEHSTHFLRSDFEKSLKLNPQIIGKEVKESGHWLNFEQLQIFIQLLKEFL